MAEGLSKGADFVKTRLPKPCAAAALCAPIRDAGEETGDKQGQNQRRGGSGDSARQNATRIRLLKESE